MSVLFPKVSQQNARAMKNLCNCIGNVCERKPSNQRGEVTDGWERFPNMVVSVVK